MDSSVDSLIGRLLHSAWTAGPACPAGLGPEREGTWTGTWVDVSEWSVQGLVLVGGNCGWSFDTRWVAFGREATCG